jgi:cell division protein FtsB
MHGGLCPSIVPGWSIWGRRFVDGISGLTHSGGRGLLSLGLGLVLLAALGLLVANFVGQALQLSHLDAQGAALEDEIAELRRSNAALEAEAEYAESDAYAERIAREQFVLAFEDDIVLLPEQLPPVDSAAQQPGTVPAAALPLSPNWVRWWQAFFPES